MARTTRTLRCDLPIDVWDRLHAEAAAKGTTIGAHLRSLVIARDKRRSQFPETATPIHESESD